MYKDPDCSGPQARLIYTLGPVFAFFYRSVITYVLAFLLYRVSYQVPGVSKLAEGAEEGVGVTFKPFSPQVSRRLLDGQANGFSGSSARWSYGCLLAWLAILAAWTASLTWTLAPIRTQSAVVRSARWAIGHKIAATAIVVASNGLLGAGHAGFRSWKLTMELAAFRLEFARIGGG